MSFDLIRIVSICNDLFFNNVICRYEPENQFDGFETLYNLAKYLGEIQSGEFIDCVPGRRILILYLFF